MLSKEFQTITDAIENADIGDLKVSKGNVGWHLDHSLKVINGVSRTLKQSNPKEYRGEFNLLRFVIFIVKRFPRGKVDAPKRVLPPEIISKEDIRNQLVDAIKNVSEIALLDKNVHFQHPVFKQLNKKQSLKFLVLHTNHHLKIIKDILK
jgi:hypothetical protein